MESESSKAGNKVAPLASQLREIIIDMPPGSRLPSEVELSARFGVSRATLRQALELLWIEGWVSRRWGDGTFTLPEPDPRQLPSAIYVDLDHIGSLRDRMAARRVEMVRTHFDLEVQPDGATAVLTRAFTINGKGALCLVDTVPTRYRRTPIDWSQMEDQNCSMQGLLAEVGCRVAKEESDAEIIYAPHDIADLLGMKRRHSLLKLHQRTISAASEVVVRTSAYIDLRYFKHRLVRIVGKSGF